MKAIILAGGLGTRLQPYTFFIPKPMLPLGNKPLLEHIIEWLKNDDNNIDHIIICVSYLHRTIEDYFEDGSRLGIKIEYARSDRPLATAGQLLTAKKYIDDTFVCVYGDSIYEFSLREMIKEHDKLDAFISMALLSYKTRLKYGFIDINGNNKVTTWNEKPEIKGLINIGCYVMEPEFIDLIPASNAYGMDDAVRKALDMKKLVNGFKIESGFIDIGDKKSYLQTYKKYVERLGKI
ncbi:MAG: nucleotidyltransferase family protein [Thermoproteota archaeon]|jgi:mannose-1-phosphate guanylyltransferase|nr:nucleotidyltransferase family protein [Thermoproteota archaeon]MDW0120005.1 nucleotidyltransferase family protein [Nitrososphaeraceae archaeon]MDW0136084.1 nucleotidyltransferase family protein [Nitrososphaeraceae archaeon]MDW0155534.1 nucleotidyltransferase family protein [Nitrososphaeraceae archaeon]RPI83875.1 MAG: nucleotidyltransferase family protein [Nitrosopumilales archaeon]